MYLSNQLWIERHRFSQKIYPEMKIGQISFYYLNSPSEAEYGDVSYGSKYQGQEGPTPSKSHSDFSS